MVYKNWFFKFQAGCVTFPDVFIHENSTRAYKNRSKYYTNKQEVHHKSHTEKYGELLHFTRESKLILSRLAYYRTKIFGGRSS